MALQLKGDPPQVARLASASRMRRGATRILSGALQLNLSASWHPHMVEGMDPQFEHVLRVDDWYDGVRGGVALFRGVPHRFVWLGWELDHWDPDEERYRLTPLAPAEGPQIVARGGVPELDNRAGPAVPAYGAAGGPLAPDHRAACQLTKR